MDSVSFYTVGISFVIGIFVYSFLDFDLYEIGLLCVISIACLFSWWQKSKNIPSPLFIAGFFFFFCALGMFRIHIAENDVSELNEFNGKYISFSGKIVREPEVRSSLIHLYVAFATKEGERQTVLVTVDRFDTSARMTQYADIVTVEGTLKQPDPFVTDNGREFDYPGYLKARGVRYVLPFADVTISSSNNTSFFARLYRWKQQFQSSIEKSINEPMAGLGEGVLLGTHRALGDELEDIFRKTGIVHIIVLSGYNIMIIVETLGIFLSYLYAPRMRIIIGLCSIALFSILVGFSPTVVRASIMAGLVIIARGSGRTYIVLRALILTGVAMLIANPYLLLYDPGFQLSFLATLGLILFSPIITERVSFISDAYGLRNVVAATLATQCMVLPLLLYHTGIFSVISILTNVLVLPAVPFAMLLTFLTGIAGLISGIFGSFFGFFAHLVLGYIIMIATFCSTVPFASFTVTTFPFWIVISIYVLIGIFSIYVLDRKKDSVLKTENIYGYDGWTIEKEPSLERQNLSPGPLPFK